MYAHFFIVFLDLMISCISPLKYSTRESTSHCFKYMFYPLTWNTRFAWFLPFFAPFARAARTSPGGSGVIAVFVRCDKAFRLSVFACCALPFCTFCPFFFSQGFRWRNNRSLVIGKTCRKRFIRLIYIQNCPVVESDWGAFLRFAEKQYLVHVDADFPFGQI